MTKNFRNIPSVNTVLESEKIQPLLKIYSHELITELIRNYLNQIRKDITEKDSEITTDEIIKFISATISERWDEWPKTILNGTGVVLHTNIGRAPLSYNAIQAGIRAASGYTNLEIDLSTGKRGSRQSKVQNLLCDLTGAESAIIVNNNATAVTLGLAAIAKGKEIIISRSESVEIGGGFRIPDVLEQSGASLKEVGTTNRTYAKDFENAISSNTGAVMSIHASNFKIIGFTATPSTKDLSEITQNHNIPLLHDVGSGCLLDSSQFGLTKEPMPQESIEDGSDVCFFSADKLLGGPQAGIILGKKQYIDKIAQHPLARAYRIDKISLAALHATLLHYIKNEALEKIPIWQMISSSEEKLKERAEKFKNRFNHLIEIIPTTSTIGGGSLPGSQLNSVGIKIKSNNTSKLADKMRNHTDSILGRIEKDMFIIDLRTITPEQDELLANALKDL
ncbi:MAG: L-seryl-tRNA(Sec) selenium transferase [Dehalococcoidia bacterium]